MINKGGGFPFAGSSRLFLRLCKDQAYIEGDDAEPKTDFGKKKNTVLPVKYRAFLVENSGIEPLTSCMPCKRSPS